MAIRRLPPGDIEKIAAGEVIERPASVVKELVENAIDAGARSVRITVTEGGLQEIQVADDGSGIAEDDLELAIERHATSKIAAFQDVERVSTLGFRGEALASIAAAAELHITSRDGASPAAAVLHVRAGQAERLPSVSRNRGTTIVVRSLFSSTPARLKFLSSPSAEAARIARVAQNLALVHPHVAVELRNNGRQILRTDGQGDRRTILAALYSAPMAERAIDLGAVEFDGIRVSGILTAPADSTNGRAMITVAVGGRLITHRSLVHAAEEAYSGMIRTDQHPLGLIHLDLPAGEVDVNVHPTKAEVRFRNERAVYSAVQRAVRGALLDAAPTTTSLPPESTAAAAWWQPAPTQSRFVVPAALEYQPSWSKPPLEPNGAASDPARAPAIVLRVVGQVGNMYIVAESADGLYMVDQHAAHERVLYERELAVGVPVDVQPLLVPAVVDLELDEVAIIEEHAPEFTDIGIHLEPFGDAAVLIRAVPSIASGRDPIALLRALLHDARSDRTTRPWRDKLAASVACHSAVRAGDSLTTDEMRALLRSLEQCRDPHHCAHGRPTMVHMSADQLERQFGRA